MQHRVAAFGLCLAAAMGGAVAAWGQDGVAGRSPETHVEDVVVVGRPVAETAREFVRTISAAPAGARLARWNMPVCVGVVGARREIAQAIIDRVADIGGELGVSAGPSGCTPNVVVVMTDDGSAMAEAMVRQNRERFILGIGNSSPGLAALERFRTSDAPIRWWHTAAPVFADSGDLAVRYQGGPPPGADAVLRGGYGAGSANRTPGRMRSNIRHDLNSVTIIVDVRRLEGVSFPALTDFIVMVALAQIDPAADFSGLPTVLDLPRNPMGVSGLTDWDRDYLTALYSVRMDRPTLSTQELDIARGLVRGRRGRLESIP